MNDRRLRYALAVWREGSFSTAAEKLSISQPSISEQVRLLEEELGFELFRRTGRGIEVTYIGRTFLLQAEEAVAGLLDLSDTARLLRGGRQGTFAVGFSSGIARNMIPRVMRSLTPVVSKFRLEVATATTRRIQRLVFQERLDIGITIEADPRSVPPDLVRERIASEEMVLLVPPDHPRSSSDEAVDLGDISRERFIINEPNIGYGELIRSMFAARGLRPRIAAISDDMETIKLLVRSGVGIAIVPKSCAAAEAEAEELTIVPVRPRHEAAITLVRRDASMGADREGYLSMIRDGFELAAQA